MLVEETDVNCTNTMGIRTLNALLENRNMKTPQQVMEARQALSGTRGLAQSMEIHDLKERIYLLEKRNRELEREVNDYRNREQELLDEIEELNEKLRYSPHQQPTKSMSTTPYILMEQPMKNEGRGLAEGWDYFMYAYTDNIFIQSDKPDLLLYWNGLSYVNPNGTVSLSLPVTQETLDEHNILKVRPLTEEELDDITTKFNLR